jgi:hypothetical protein
MAGNPLAGEVGFEAGGEAYSLVFDFNTICTLEALYEGETFAQIAGRIGEGMRATDLRTIFAAGLRHEHGAVTELKAGEIISELGMGEAGLLIARAMAASFPKEVTPKGGARPQRPAPAGGTTRPRSKPGASSGANQPHSGG